MRFRNLTSEPIRLARKTQEGGMYVVYIIEPDTDVVDIIEYETFIGTTAEGLPLYQKSVKTLNDLPDGDPDEQREVWLVSEDTARQLKLRGEKRSVSFPSNLEYVKSSEGSSFAYTKINYLRAVR